MTEPRRPAVFHNNGYGDRLLALPAVRALARRFSGRLTVVGGPLDLELFYPDLPLRRLVGMEFLHGPDSRELDAAVLARELRGADLLVSFNTWHNEGVEELLWRLAGVPSVGFTPGFGVELPIGNEHHASDSFFAAARLFDPSLRLEEHAYPPVVGPEAAAAARRIRSLLPPESRILALHTETAAAKTWPVDRMKIVLDRFLEAHPQFIALILDKGRSGLDGIPRGERVIPYSGLHLPAAMALVREADLFLGVDSCLLHFADLARVPGVGLYGPTSPRRWGFRFTRHRHVAAGDMSRIAVPDVLDALESLLGETEEAAQSSSSPNSRS